MSASLLKELKVKICDEYLEEPDWLVIKIFMTWNYYKLCNI